MAGWAGLVDETEWAKRPNGEKGGWALPFYLFLFNILLQFCNFVDLINEYS